MAGLWLIPVRLNLCAFFIRFIERTKVVRTSTTYGVECDPSIMSTKYRGNTYEGSAKSALEQIRVFHIEASVIKMPKRKSGSLLHVKMPKSEPLFLFAIFKYESPGTTMTASFSSMGTDMTALNSFYLPF